jgi:hypothetical protein
VCIGPTDRVAAAFTVADATELQPVDEAPSYTGSHTATQPHSHRTTQPHNHTTTHRHTHASKQPHNRTVTSTPIPTSIPHTSIPTSIPRPRPYRTVTSTPHRHIHTAPSHLTAWPKRQTHTYTHTCTQTYTHSRLRQCPRVVGRCASRMRRFCCYACGWVTEHHSTQLVGTS